MRQTPLAALALSLLLIGAAQAADPQRAVTVNARISPATKEITLNQPLRIDFVTMPRQVENIDIAAAVANAVALSGGSSWRLLGRPVVSEHEKTHTVSISLALLPRESGKRMLPQIPLSWLQGDQYAEFGEVKIADKIAIGGENEDPPKETVGIAGFIWGAKLADLKTTRIPDNLIEVQGDRAVARPQPGLELIFRNGELAEATIAAPGLSLEQARDSFFTRWGLPQLEVASADRPGAITWIIGWTRITATQDPGDQGGVRLALVREDIEARQSQARVRGAVFDVLEGTTLPKPAETEDQAKERRKREAEDFLKQQQQQQQGPKTNVPAPAPAPATAPAPGPAAPAPAPVEAKP